MVARNGAGYQEEVELGESDHATRAGDIAQNDDSRGGLRMSGRRAMLFRYATAVNLATV